MNEMDQVIRIFPQKLRELLRRARTEEFPAQELRLRVGRPLLMTADGREWVLDSDQGRWMCAEGGEKSRHYLVSGQDIRDTLEYMSRYSLYAFDEELRQGFLTAAGGHRIGLTGQAVLGAGSVKTLRNISSLNIRVARQVKGCAAKVLPWLYREGELCSSLIISPPGCGKTTLLRDLIRQVSDGWGDLQNMVPGITVGVVDERSELGACLLGVPQNDLGTRTDVLDSCPKAEGMMMLIRSMAPGVVAVDEIGSREDMEALRYGINCGCRLLATVHGSSYEEICRKPVLNELAESGVFERYVILTKKNRPGQVKEILNGRGEVIARGGKDW